MINNLENAHLVDLTNVEIKNIQGGSFIGYVIGFLGAAAEYVAEHESKINLPGGQAMKQ